MNKWKTAGTTSESALSVRPSAAGSYGIISRWLRLLIGVTVIVAFVFVVLPAVQRWSPVRVVHEATTRHGIDAAALFYSEIDESYEAELSVRHALRFSPRPDEVNPRQSTDSHGGD